MGKFPYCLKNKPDGGNGRGQCFDGRIKPIHVERSGYLLELKRLGILPGYFPCNGFDCNYPTIAEKYRPQYRWTRAWVRLQD